MRFVMECHGIMEWSLKKFWTSEALRQVLRCGMWQAEGVKLILVSLQRVIQEIYRQHMGESTLVCLSAREFTHGILSA